MNNKYAYSDMITSLKTYMENFLENFTIETKYGAIAATATPIIIYGMYFAWGHASRVLKRSQPIFRRSMSMGVIHGGEPAFLRLKDYKEARANPTITVTAEKVLRYSLLKDHPDFLQLQVRVSLSNLQNFQLKSSIAKEIDITLCVWVKEYCGKARNDWKRS